MLDLNIHNVVSVELSAIKEFDEEGITDAFTTRKLYIVDNKGQRTTITLFGGTGDDLKAKVSTSALTLDV
jgi:hypothetical protein